MFSMKLMILVAVSAELQTTVGAFECLFSLSLMYARNVVQQLY